MRSKNYRAKINNQIEKKLDRIIQYSALVAFVSAFVIYFSAIPKWFSISVIFAGLLLLVLARYSKQITVEIKMTVAIFISISIGILAYVVGGLSSHSISLIMISNIISYSFLSKNKSRLLSILSLIILLSFWIGPHFYPNEWPTHITPELWMVQILIFILYILILKATIYTNRKYLKENFAELEDNVDAIYQLAYIDRLTNLPNQHLFKIQVKEKVKPSLKQGYIILININNLNMINSIYSNEVGDDVLIDTAKILNKLKNRSEIVARVSGNEFVVWMENINEDAMIARLISFEEYFINHFNVSNMTMKIQFCSGYSIYNSKTTIEACYQKAGIALTYAKINSINHVIAYEEQLGEAIRDQEQIKEALEEALRVDEFQLYYQTKVNAITHEIIGVEALSRWHSKTLGIVGPNVFIPVIEKMNHATLFGQLILKKAISSYDLLCKKYNKQLTLSINISPTHLISNDFSTYVEETLKKYGVEPSNIILEITEEVMIQQLDEVILIISQLKDIGVLISLDDFGSGYSSFNYLTSFDIDEIKIDKSLIDQIESNKKVSSLMQMFILFAQQGELTIVAEGVEKRTQCDQLIELGCEVIQGYLFSRPEPL